MNRIKVKIVIGLSLLILAFTITSQAQDKQPNVLLICIDDLRPELGAYGNEVVKSPNLDKLAQQAYLFNKHYAVVPTCGPSRYSFLTGMLPRTPAALTNEAIHELIAKKNQTEAPNPKQPESFIQHLRQNGYYTD